MPDVPPELKGRDETKGEASLRGHLKNGEDEGGGSSAYVPPDPKNDKQLNYALELLRSGRAAADKMLQASKPN
jgi:carboxyl-terminal processing protease